jgi:hypothetical protein
VQQSKKAERILNRNGATLALIVVFALFPNLEVSAERSGKVTNALTSPNIVCREFFPTSSWKLGLLPSKPNEMR